MHGVKPCRIPRQDPHHLKLKTSPNERIHDFRLFRWQAAVLVTALALLVALAVDHCLGEPRAHWHPVVWMGRYLAWTGRRVAPHLNAKMQGQGKAHPLTALEEPDYVAFTCGAIAWIAGGLAVYLLSWLLQERLLSVSMSIGLASIASDGMAALLIGFALKPMLAWSMLRGEVLAVEKALSPAHGGSLAAGRERLSWLVSRNVTNLSEAQVRESAIESLAENLNDSVVAPIFWFALLGLPGAALYRFANTADAMWGYHGVYKNQNWEWAGKWAARVDDMLSWLPARITALLLLVSFRPRANSNIRQRPWASKQRCSSALSCMNSLCIEACRTPSPNSGWPMAAMALSLGVSLRKPGVYALNVAGRSPQAQDTQRALAQASRAVLALVLLLTLAVLAALGLHP
jgi:adenosylcobinamide-phosphate synthase